MHDRTNSHFRTIRCGNLQTQWPSNASRASRLIIIIVICIYITISRERENISTKSRCPQIEMSTKFGSPTSAPLAGVDCG